MFMYKMTFNTRYIHFVMILAVLFLYTGCGDSDDKGPVCSTAWSAELETEVNNLTASAQAFGMNPSATTCASYRVAAQAYLDALDPYGDCAALSGQNRADWELAVEEAQQSINDLDCSSYD